MVKTTRIFDIEKAVHGNKVKTDFVTVPFTSIRNEHGQNRKIADLENNLKASFGVERVHTNSIIKKDKETGPNGEVVWELSNKDSRVRFVGDWSSASATDGTYANAQPNAYIEITFYGTGLNLLTNINASARDFRATTDGGAEGANFYPSSASSVLNGRNYNPNQVLQVTSGLSLGWHTVKIRNAHGSSDMRVNGFEILNQSSQVMVNAGQPFVGGYAAKLDAQALLDTKPTALTGTKGGRVVDYLTEDGTLQQAVTPVDVTAQYLGSADHSNEEIARKINFREFGKNRADDFSTLSASLSNRFFTLDDGTSTLVGLSVSTITESNLTGVAVDPNSPTYFITISFIGTGIDLIQTRSGGTSTFDFIIDNVTIGTGSVTSLNIASGKLLKVASGLPYGFHTLKIKTNTLVSGSIAFSDFIIYQPKKPTLPENVIEIADYNVMADFVANTTAGLTTVSTGALRKTCFRELTLVNGTGGTVDWTFEAFSSTEWVNGQSLVTDRNGAYVEYTFYGTGFDFRFRGGSNSTNISVTLNGQAATAANFPSITSSVYGASAFSAGVLNQSGSNTPGSGLVIKNLPLAKYTVRMTNNTTVAFRLDALDIITPIHANSKDFKIGSMALLDLRNDQQLEGVSKKIDMSRAKAWLYFNQVNQTVLSSYNISAVLDDGATSGEQHIYFKHPFKNTNYIAVALGETQNTSYRKIVTGSTAENGEKQANFYTTQMYDHDGTPTDSHLCIVFFGELENEEDINLEDL